MTSGAGRESLWRWLSIAIALTILSGAAHFLIPYFTPTTLTVNYCSDAVFSSDKKQIWYLERDVRTVGPPPHLIPDIAGFVEAMHGNAKPVKVRLEKDRFTLHLLDVASGRLVRSFELPKPPWAPRTLMTTTRGAPVVEAVLALPATGDPEYFVRTFHLEGGDFFMGNGRTAGNSVMAQNWQPYDAGHNRDGLERTVERDGTERLSGDLEVVASGSLFLLDHRRHAVRLLAGSAVPVEYAFSLSRRADIEKLARLRAIGLRLTQGQIDMEEYQREWAQVQNNWKVETISGPTAEVTATLLPSPAGSSVEAAYELSDADFKYRLHPSVREAILHPGRKGTPPSHLDLQTNPSEATRLNEFLWQKTYAEKSSASVYVKYRKRVFSLTLMVRTS